MPDCAVKLCVCVCVCESERERAASRLACPGETQFALFPSRLCSTPAMIVISVINMVWPLLSLYYVQLFLIVIMKMLCFG